MGKIEMGPQGPQEQKTEMGPKDREQEKEQIFEAVRSELERDGYHYVEEETVGLLAGDDSEEAWRIREKLAEHGDIYSSSCNEDFSSLVVSIYGMEEERAWALRDKLAEKHPSMYWDAGNRRHFYSVDAAKSTLGVVSERADDVRRKALKDAEFDDGTAYSFGVPFYDRRESQRSEAANAVMFSLRGQDTERAWQLRDEAVKSLLKNNYKKEAQVFFRDDILLKNLVGLDSEKAWEVRDDFAARAINGEKNKYSKKLGVDSLLSSLTGVDSDRAWEIRQESIEKLKTLMEEAKDGNENKVREKKDLQSSLLDSITGLDSEKAWELRQMVIKDNSNLQELLSSQTLYRVKHSLIGVDSPRAGEMLSSIEQKIGPSPNIMRMIKHGGDIRIALFK